MRQPPGSRRPAAFDQLRRNSTSRPVLLSADNARAAATLAYYNEMQDSAIR
jgi:hypothetical protein